MVVSDLNIDCPVTRTNQLIGDPMDFVAFVRTNVHCHYIHVIVRGTGAEAYRDGPGPSTISTFYEPAFTHCGARSDTAIRRT